NVNPNSGQQGTNNLAVTITGNFTHFSNSSVVTFSGSGVAAGAPTSATATSITVNVTIQANAAVGARDVIVTTGAEAVTLINGFTVTGAPALLSITPNSGAQGTAPNNVQVVGSNTHFTATSVLDFGANSGIVVSNLNVADSTHLSVTLTISPTASLGNR